MLDEDNPITLAFIESMVKALSCAHRAVLRTAALSLLMTALPSSAFGTAMFSALAASTAHTFRPKQLLRPLSIRGPKGVVDGKQVNIPVPLYTAMGGRRRLGDQGVGCPCIS